MINVSGEELPLRIATKQEMGSVHTLPNYEIPVTAPITNQIE